VRRIKIKEFHNFDFCILIFDIQSRRDTGCQIGDIIDGLPLYGSYSDVGDLFCVPILLGQAVAKYSSSARRPGRLMIADFKSEIANRKFREAYNKN
jgi:hypothetical protein